MDIMYHLVDIPLIGDIVIIGGWVTGLVPFPQYFI
jgi:hypothetical protein